eukprot:9564015-Alexandrium_andersonii.AAC.1
MSSIMCPAEVGRCSSPPRVRSGVVNGSQSDPHAHDTAAISRLGSARMSTAKRQTLGRRVRNPGRRGPSIVERLRG